MPLLTKPPQAPKTKEPCMECGKIDGNRMFNSIRKKKGYVVLCKEHQQDLHTAFERGIKKRRKEMGIKTKRDTQLDDFIKGAGDND